MAWLQAGGVPVDADLVVFDKDGTLLDFESMWGELLRAAVAALSCGVANSVALAAALYADVGYDVACQRTLPQCPWAMATTDQVLTILAASLYRHGYPWPEAEDAVRSTWHRLTAPDRLAALVQPTADLAGLFSALQSAGIRSAVVTTDTRQATEQAIHLLGIDGLVDAVLCSDDGLPPKPAPDQVLALYGQWGIAAERTVVVGDTVFDLLMGRRAAVGRTVGVLTGAGSRESLAPYADMILQSVGELGIVGSSAPLARPSTRLSG